MKYERTEKSAVAEYAKNRELRIQFDKVKILNKDSHFGKRMHKEVLEIDKCLGTTKKMDKRLEKHVCQLYIRKKEGNLLFS